MTNLILSKSTRREILLDKISKLELKEGDIIVVRDQEDFKMFVELIESGIPITKTQNPILCMVGGVERATRKDLVAALEFIDNQQQSSAAEEYNEAVETTTKKYVQ